MTTCLFIGQVTERRGLEVLVQSQLDMLPVSPAPEWRLHVTTLSQHVTRVLPVLSQDARHR